MKHLHNKHLFLNCFSSQNCSSLIFFVLLWHLCLGDGSACTERRFICQHLSGYGKCFEVYYRSFRAASEGFHFYCLEAGGGIIAPHCTGGSRGWRLAAAEGPIDYWPGVKFYPACFSCLCQILYYPERWGVTAFPPEAEKKSLQFGVLLSSSFFLTKRGKYINAPLLLVYFYFEARDYLE